MTSELENQIPLGVAESNSYVYNGSQYAKVAVLAGSGSDSTSVKQAHPLEFSHAEVNSYVCIDGSSLNVTPAIENQKLYAKVIFIPGYSESMSNKADLVNGKVPASQLPSYVDDVLEYENFEDLPQPGETGKIYVITGDNDKQHNQYRWSGSQYTLITNQSILQLISDVDTLTLTVSNNKTAIENALSVETNNRTTADNTLQNNINTLSTTVSNNKTVIENALSDEIDNRTTADNTLQDNIDTLSTTVINNKADLDDEIENIQSDLNDNSTGIKARLNQVEQHISLPDIYNNGKNISINGSTISLNDNLLDLSSIEISTQSILKTSSDVTITKKDGSNHDVVIKLNDTNILLGTTSELNGTPYGNYLQVNIGIQNELTGLLAYAHGKGNKATGRYSVADGYKNTASADNAHAEGQTNTASGSHSHAEGELSEASGRASHAEGTSSKAIGQGSHAEGGSKATGVSAHAEGSQTEANGTCSHSEGQQTKTIGSSSHSEGYLTIAEGFVSHAEGVQTHSIGEGSHAEGTLTVTNGEGSHAEGFGTIATRPYQHVEGTFNESSNLYQHIVGGGNSDQNRKNIQTLDWQGNQWNSGKITAENGFYEGLKKISTEEYVDNGLNEKVDKVLGKELSTNDYTDAEKNKLSSIESNAQVNIIEDVKVDGSSLTVSNKSVNIDLSGKVDKVSGKGLSTEDYTTNEKSKLTNIESGAQVNIIETVKVNNTILTIDNNKSINIEVPVNLSDLNDDNYTGKGYTKRLVNSDTTCQTGDWLIVVGNCNITLPQLSEGSFVKITTASENITNVIIIPQQSDTIEGDSEGLMINTNHSLCELYGTTNEWIISEAK